MLDKSEIKHKKNRQKDIRIKLSCNIAFLVNKYMSCKTSKYIKGIKTNNIKILEAQLCVGWVAQW